MLKELDGWVARGDSETVITSAFVQEFGTKVYAEPPRIGPELGGLEPADRLFAAGTLLVIFVIWRWRSRCSAAACCCSGPSGRSFGAGLGARTPPCGQETED